MCSCISVLPGDSTGTVLKTVWMCMISVAPAIVVMAARTPRRCHMNHTDTRVHPPAGQWRILSNALAQVTMRAASSAATHKRRYPDLYRTRKITTFDIAACPPGHQCDIEPPRALRRPFELNRSYRLLLPAGSLIQADSVARLGRKCTRATLFEMAGIKRLSISANQFHGFRHCRIPEHA